MKSIEQRFKRIAVAIQRAWYKGAPWLPLLYPLSYLVAAVARRRLARFRRRADSPSVPVIVVGNVTVGGTGKTPLVIALCDYFRLRQLRVVVISRGYGARPPSFPWVVETNQSQVVSGDEPMLIRRRAGVPVVIDPQRRRALDYAIERFAPDVIISDDGLQHYRLPRTMEIVVLDAERGIGNGRCLPAGPLREPASRIGEVDYVVINGRPDVRWPGAMVMVLETDDPVNMRTGDSMPMEEFAARHPVLHAFAGIGNPQRFFSALSSWDLRVTAHPRPDHHQFSAADFAGLEGQTVIMTEKDAVKCGHLANEDFWCLPVSARLPGVFLEGLMMQVKRSRS